MGGAFLFFLVGRGGLTGGRMKRSVSRHLAAPKLEIIFFVAPLLCLSYLASHLTQAQLVLILRWRRRRPGEPGTRLDFRIAVVIG